MQWTFWAVLENQERLPVKLNMWMSIVLWSSQVAGYAASKSSRIFFSQIRFKLAFPIKKKIISLERDFNLHSEEFKAL